MKKIGKYLFNFEYPLLFTICMALAAAFCCSTGGVAMINEKNMTVLDLLQAPKYIPQVDANSAFNAVFSGWFLVLLPAISSLVPIVSFCDEMNKGYYQYYVGREGLRAYLKRKYAKIAVYGIMVTLLGLLLYFAAVYIVFPRSATFMGVQMEATPLLTELAKVFKDMLSISVCAGALAVMTYGIALFVHNKYVVISIPVYVNYVFRDIIWEHMILVSIIIFTLGYVVCAVRAKKSFV